MKLDWEPVFIEGFGKGFTATSEQGEEFIVFDKFWYKNCVGLWFRDCENVDAGKQATEIFASTYE